MKKRNPHTPYAALERAVADNDRVAVRAAMAKLTDHEKDLLVDCPVTRCRAAERKECAGEPDGRAHFGRRLKRMLEGIR